MRLLAALTVGVLPALVVVPCVALAHSERRDHVVASTAGLFVAQVKLTGKAAKPRGELSGSGSVTICVDQAGNSISFGFDQLWVTGQPTTGHIHRGGAGTAGAIVSSFGVPGSIDPMVGDIQWYGTVTATKSAISLLIRSPGKHYVDVHTKKYAKGAVRGQLGTWKRATAGTTTAAVCGIG